MVTSDINTSCVCESTKYGAALVNRLSKIVNTARLWGRQGMLYEAFGVFNDHWLLKGKGLQILSNVARFLLLR